MCGVCRTSLGKEGGCRVLPLIIIIWLFVGIELVTLLLISLMEIEAEGEETQFEQRILAINVLIFVWLLIA